MEDYNDNKYSQRFCKVYIENSIKHKRVIRRGEQGSKCAYQ